MRHSMIVSFSFLLMLGAVKSTFADSSTSSQIQLLNSQLNIQMQNMNTTFQQQIQTLNKQLQAQIKSSHESVEAMVHKLNKNTADQMKKLQSQIDQLQQEAVKAKS